MPDELEIQYPSLDVIPEPFRPLYEDKGGFFMLTKVKGMKTEQDVNNVSEALRKERADHAAAKGQLKPWEEFGKPDEVRQKLARIPELEAAAQGKLDEPKIQQIVESRLSQKIAPLEQANRTLTEQLEAANRTNAQLLDQIHSRDRNEIVRSAATAMNVQPTAIPDIELVASMMMERLENGTFITKAGLPGVTPGLDVNGFLKEMQKTRPHWWPPSQGGGAGGGAGGGNGDVNPFAHDTWNITAQGVLVREKGLSAAEQMAKAAGTTVGGPRPAKK